MAEHGGREIADVAREDDRTAVEVSVARAAASRSSVARGLAPSSNCSGSRVAATRSRR